MSKRAAIYLRISLDQFGDGLAIERQQQDCEAIVTYRGWELVNTYVDQSISATDKTKRRPAYDQMTADYQAGLFDAIVCWDLDRLTRQPRQLEDWIDAAEDEGLAIVTANGEADLGTDSGRLFARIKAATARSEVERLSARAKRKNMQKADSGHFTAGRRPFGYTADERIIPQEAEVVHAIYDAFLRGT
ncbi:MAG: recombinase family protein, partial [Eggerthellaceae bacterium]|nr:recombinase family protein [Eggerthellaceae bacterium]